MAKGETQKVKTEEKKAASAMKKDSKHKIVKTKDAVASESLPFEVTDYHKKALLKLLFCHHSGQVLTYLELSDEIGAGEKTKAWQCGAWKDLKGMGYIVPSPDSKGKTQYMLSEKGVELATTFASDEELADYKMPETNEEHHEKIKSKLMRQEKAKKFGPKIFDLLLQKDTPMTRHEIAEEFNTLADSHGFFYGLQALKKMGLVVEAGVAGKKAKRNNTDTSEKEDDASSKKKKKRSGGNPLKLSEKAFLVTAGTNLSTAESTEAQGEEEE